MAKSRFGFLTIRLIPLLATLLLMIACNVPSLVVRPETITSTSQVEVTPKVTPSPTLMPEISASPSARPTEDAIQAVVTPTTTAVTAPLSPLDKSLQTVVFTTAGEQGSMIWRMQVNEQGEKVGPVERIEFPLSHRIRLYGLFPSPDGQKIAIHWNRANTSYVSILDVNTGKVSPLLGEQTKLDASAYFLAWVPDGQKVLVFGFPGSDLDGSAWIVNINTFNYQDVAIKQKDSKPEITSASFSPDGNTIVYGQQDCIGCNNSSKIWQITTDGTERRLLFENSEVAFSVDDLIYSPDGNYIAFLHWQRYPPSGATGDLYVMKRDGSGLRLLSSAMVDAQNRFQPHWSANSQQILFVRQETGDKQLRNLYIAEAGSGKIKQLTDLQSSELLYPTWSPNESRIAFLANLDGKVKSWTVMADGSNLRLFSLNDALRDIEVQQLSETQSNDFDLYSSFIWLP